MAQVATLQSFIQQHKKEIFQLFFNLVHKTSDIPPDYKKALDSKEGHRWVRLYINLICRSLTKGPDDFLEFERYIGKIRATQGYSVEGPLQVPRIFQMSVRKTLCHYLENGDPVVWQRISSDLQLLNSLMDQSKVALLVSYVQTREDLITKHNQYLQEFYNLASNFFSISDAKWLSTLEKIIQKITEIMQADNCGLLLVDEANHRQVQTEITSRGAAIFKDTPRAVRRLLKQIEADTAPFKIRLRLPTQEPGARQFFTFYIVPLLAHHEFFGLLYFWDKTRLDFSIDELNLLRGFATAIATQVENWRLLQGLAEKESVLQNLITQSIHAQEDERKRIAGEVHDGVLQLIYGSLYQLDASLKLFAEDNFPKAIESVTTGKIRLNEALTELRRVISNLRPSILDDLGLIPALKSLFSNFEEETGIRAALEIRGREPEISSEIQISLYRIVQEALANIKRHSKASQVKLKLDLRSDQIVLSISDNGVGMETIRPLDYVKHGQFGLIGMTERVNLLYGNLEIDTAPNQGTTLNIEIPKRKAG